ncbi:non-homologous end-joining DNA ligase [Asanoa sp. NPDC050611]|uniref:non-homologous end-joining DNA ligase n=1 Tax=Asanoa sp. NPDC050611 TaxID=3157098 RepID=UPI0033E37ABB
MTGDPTVRANGRAVRVSTPGRVLFPDVPFTKGDLVAYYLDVAEAVLPHIRGRPLTLHRFPYGVYGRHFYQTRTPPHPDWIRTAVMHYPRTGKTFEAPVIDDTAGLVWAANLAAVELHPFLGRADDLDRPTGLVFDLDPGFPASLADACAVALDLAETLAATGLRAWPKTSGLKGLHVHVPLNTPVTFDETKAHARTVAALLARRAPERVVDRMTRAVRAGKVFIDWSQNDPGKSTVAPYALRGLPTPSAATPATWDEVRAWANGSAEFPAFGPANIRARLARYGDLVAPLNATQQALGF